MDGSRRNLTNSLATFDFLPTWAPDGTRIAYASSTVNGNVDIHIISLDRSENRRLTFDPARDVRPTWHPSGTRLAFASDRDGNAEVYSINADGTGLVNLTNHPSDDDTPAWSHDGTRIAFESNRSIGILQSEIFLMDPDGNNQRQLLSIEGAVHPAWSPGDSLTKRPGGGLAHYAQWPIVLLLDCQTSTFLCYSARALRLAWGVDL